MWIRDNPSVATPPPPRALPKLFKTNTFSAFLQSAEIYLKIINMFNPLEVVDGDGEIPVGYNCLSQLRVTFIHVDIY